MRKSKTYVAYYKNCLAIAKLPIKMFLIYYYYY